MEASHGRALSSNVSEIEEEAPAMEEEDMVYVAVPAEYKAGKSAFFLGDSEHLEGPAHRPRPRPHPGAADSHAGWQVSCKLAQATAS